MNSEIILKAENVTFRYKKDVIKNASFAINKGFVYGVVGKNSVGKSTLLNLLAGRIFPCEGNIAMEGAENLADYRNNIGVITEENEFLLHLGVIENAKILGSLYKNFDIDRFKEYIDKYNIDGLRTLSTLSGGEMIKFQIAFSLSYEPDIMIMDEPAGLLDTESREEFINLIRLLATEKNITVIMATHLTKDLDYMADYILFINDDGKITLYDKETLNDRYMLLKGSKIQLENVPRNAIMALEESETSVTAMTDCFDEIKETVEKSGIVTEIPDIENIMYFTDKADDLRRKNHKDSEREGDVRGKTIRIKNHWGTKEDYKRFTDAYKLMYTVCGTKWGIRIFAAAMFSGWCMLIMADGEWSNKIHEYIFLGLMHSMFLSSFEAPQKMDFIKVWDAFRYKPVSTKDFLRRFWSGKLKGSVICMIILLIIGFRNIKETIIIGVPYIIALFIIDAAIDLFAFREKK